MTTNANRLAKKAVAIIVIVAILDVIGIAPILIMFFVGATLVVWLVLRRSNHRETRQAFEFYVAAGDILRDEERHWYGFEIEEVIDQGEQVLQSMPDPPLLVYSALGALYHRVGDYDAAVESLGRVVADGHAEELQREPSSQLHRYVRTLRTIERDPAVAPQALAAVRSLERMRRTAPSLLAESRLRLANASEITRGDTAQIDLSLAGREPQKAVEKKLSSITPPPPISEVLRDVYQ